MKIRIKVKPEDFVVNEQISLPIRQKGDYRIYLLEKQNWNTVDVLIRLAQNFKIPLPQIGYGGKKDRYGLTRQYITTPDSIILLPLTKAIPFCRLVIAMKPCNRYPSSETIFQS